MCLIDPREKMAPLFHTVLCGGPLFSLGRGDKIIFFLLLPTAVTVCSHNSGLRVIFKVTAIFAVYTEPCTVKKLILHALL